MTPHDEKLCEIANSYSRYQYGWVDELIKKAETDEGRQRLSIIRGELYELCECIL